MTQSVRLGVCLVAFMCTGGAWAQSQDSQVEESASAVSAPVAHVYVNSGNKILAFSAAANGKLTTVPGSPFNYDLSLTGANGHFLFGFEPNTLTIGSFSMAANGALRKAASTNTLDFTTSDCAPFVGGGFTIDHAGLTLYNLLISTDFGCTSIFQSFRIDDANGELTHLGDTDPGLLTGVRPSVLGNDRYAYSLSCFFYGNEATPDVVALERESNGELATSGGRVGLPAAPGDPANPGDPGFYCPSSIVTDPTNHAALQLFAVGDNGISYGPVVIAAYTADAKGNLTTTNTYKNMATLPMGPDDSCLACNTLRPSPSGKFLAAGGSGGAVLYHFNGGDPLTKYKSLLADNAINQILWDNDNHLYALGRDSKGNGKLWVYAVTPTSTTEAPGSPYSIANAGNMVVQPLQ